MTQDSTHGSTYHPTDGEDLTHEPTEALVEQLAEEFIERHRRGEAPSGEKLIEEYIAAHPDLSDEIRDLFPMIAALEGCHLDDSAAASGATIERFDCPMQLGDDLRLLREIGRGGMGIVYEAVQESLGRRVAVKVLPHQVFFDNKKLQRFRREARAAGALNHPHVVTVYSVGEQTGLHYLVMPLIEGVALDTLIETIAYRSTPVGGTIATDTNNREIDLNQSLAHALMVGDFSGVATVDPRAASPADKTQRQLDPTVEFSQPYSNQSNDTPPESLAGNPTVPLSLQGETLPKLVPQTITSDSYWHSAARVIQQAADALAHAHAAGTLHRDIKPGNLIIDRKGNAWVTDFGLAKALEQNDLSLTGEVVGTLRYMAPEQLNGDTDQRSDIYSLGLTLYELLCLRPAFTGETPSKLIREITSVPPPAPRELNPAVPRDLETITLKAIATAPEDRYQTAAALADDLARYLDAKPVSVMPATKLQTYQAWQRRNPLIAGLVAAVIVLSLTTVIGLAAFLNAPPPGPPGGPPNGPPHGGRPGDSLRSDGTQRFGGPRPNRPDASASAENPPHDFRHGEDSRHRPPHGGRHRGPDGHPFPPPPHHLDESGRQRPPRPDDHPPGTHPPPRHAPDSRQPR